MIHGRPHPFPVLVPLVTVLLLVGGGVCRAQPLVKQMTRTSGYQSPAISSTTSNNVTIIYQQKGFSKEDLAFMAKCIVSMTTGPDAESNRKVDAENEEKVGAGAGRKGSAMHDQMAKFQRKYEELLDTLGKAFPGDVRIMEVRNSLSSWDLLTAEKHLLEYQKAVLARAAKSKACYALGCLMELQMESEKATYYYTMAKGLARPATVTAFRGGMSAATGLVGLETRLNQLGFCAGYIPDWPIVGGIKYYFRERGSASWYIGLAGGYRDSLGEGIRDDASGYLVAGLAGWRRQLGQRWDVNLGVGPGIYVEKIPSGRLGDAGDAQVVIALDVAIGCWF